MDMKQRMHANLPYKAWLDGLSEERAECKRKIYEFNNCHPMTEIKWTKSSARFSVRRVTLFI